MAKITLKSGETVLIDDEDLEFLSQYNWYLIKGRHTNYAATSINGRAVIMHRIINKTPTHLVTDHINRNGLDNRKSNLRSVTKSMNALNRDRSKDARILKRKGKKQWRWLYGE